MTGNSLRVLVVDDERAIRRFLRASLTAHGYTVYEAGGGQEALSAVVEDRPDLIILDLGLPGLSGIEVTARLREWTHIPIIILSVRDEEASKIAALDAGADDYLIKPFGMGELLARIRVAVRHTTRPADDLPFRVGDLEVDLSRRRVSAAGHDVALTPTEYDLLRFLVQHAGKVLTHRELISHVWGPKEVGESHLLQVNISNLRRKLEPNPSRPSYIITEVGVGYRLRVQV